MKKMLSIFEIDDITASFKSEKQRFIKTKSVKQKYRAEFEFADNFLKGFEETAEKSIIDPIFTQKEFLQPFSKVMSDSCETNVGDLAISKDLYQSVIEYYEKKINEKENHFNKITLKDDDLKNKFFAYYNEWLKDKGLSSSLTEKWMHPSYQKIIGLGKQVLPYIFKDLQRKPSIIWFWALSSITGENPFSNHSNQVSVKEATKIWLKWAEKEGYV